MEQMEIRAYGRTELALLYFPHLTAQAAYRKLQYWIDMYPGLRENMMEHGYRMHGRMFMPVHVRMIFEAIGVP